METRKLGWTDLELTTIGLGTWAIGGGGWRFAWGPQDDQASIRTIHRALDLGINWIDTAAVYGTGHSEEVVGKAVAGMSKRPIIATKCGLVWDGKRRVSAKLKRDSVLAEAEASLRRLGLEVIDLYQIHWPNPDADIEEAWEAMSRLIEAGKVRYGGVSNFSVDQLNRVQSVSDHRVASLQPPYSMLMRAVEDAQLPYCAEHDIGVVAYSPMHKGLLTGKFSAERVAGLANDDHRRRDPDFQGESLTATLRLVDALRELAEREDLTPAQLAIAWVLRRPEVTSAIVGARRPEQIAETVGAAGRRLSDASIDRIEALLAERWANR